MNTERIPYREGLQMSDNHHVATYRIYALKHPATQEIFYVGLTTQQLKMRLGGHLAAVSAKNQTNQGKNNYIRAILDSGNKPVIEEIELIVGTCYLDRINAFSRELFWINHYHKLNPNLTNVDGKGVEQTPDLEVYLSSLANGKTQWRYYHCGYTVDGKQVIDEQKLNRDGFYMLPTPEPPPPPPQYDNYNPWKNPRFLKAIGQFSDSDVKIYDFEAYKDFDSDYYEQDNCTLFT